MLLHETGALSFDPRALERLLRLVLLLDLADPAPSVDLERILRNHLDRVTTFSSRVRAEFKKLLSRT